MNTHTLISSKRLLIGFLVLVLSYFVYHIYHGERGLIAKDSLEKEYAILQKTHNELIEKREKLENKINSLGAGDGQIDPDLLNEHAKKMGYIAPNEIMITD